MKFNKLMLTMLFILGVFVLTQCSGGGGFTPELCQNPIYQNRPECINLPKPDGGGDCSQSPGLPECTAKPSSCGEGTDCVRAIYSSNTDVLGSAKLIGYLANLSVSWGVIEPTALLPEGEEAILGEDARIVLAQKEYLNLAIYDAWYPDWAYHVEVAPMPNTTNIGRIRPPFPAYMGKYGYSYMLAMNDDLERTPYNFVDPRIMTSSDYLAVITCYKKGTSMFDLLHSEDDIYHFYLHKGSPKLFEGNLYLYVYSLHALSGGQDEEGNYFKMAFRDTTESDRPAECVQLGQELRKGMETATFHKENLKFPLTIKWVDRANNNYPVKDGPEVIINIDDTVDDLDRLKTELGLN